MTQYFWPTWADIAATKFEKFENWADPGAGNHYIFNSIIECDVKNNLVAEDTIVVMWSGPVRHDYYAVNKWGHVHQKFNHDNNMLHCPDGYWADTFSYIYAVDQILKQRGISYAMTSWLDYNKFDSRFHERYKNLLNDICYIPISKQPNLVTVIQQHEEIITKLYDALSGPSWPSLENIKQNWYSTTPEIQKEIDDFWKHLHADRRVEMTFTETNLHPLPSEHLKIAKLIFPTLDFGVDIEKKVQILDDKLKNKKNFTQKKDWI